VGPSVAVAETKLLGGGSFAHYSGAEIALQGQKTGRARLLASFLRSHSESRQKAATVLRSVTAFAFALVTNQKVTRDIAAALLRWS
jgi:hypothetical protein